MVCDGMDRVSDVWGPRTKPPYQEDEEEQLQAKTHLQGHRGGAEQSIKWTVIHGCWRKTFATAVTVRANQKKRGRENRLANDLVRKRGSVIINHPPSSMGNFQHKLVSRLRYQGAMALYHSAGTIRHWRLR